VQRLDAIARYFDHTRLAVRNFKGSQTTGGTTTRSLGLVLLQAHIPDRAEPMEED